MMFSHTDMFIKLHHQSQRRDSEENRQKDASKFDDAVGALHRIIETYDMSD